MSPTQELVHVGETQLARSDEAQRFLPVMSMAVAVERRGVIVQAVQHLMKEGMDGDYGTIPGTPKPTLLQPGADKLCNLFGLVPTFEVVEKELDWTGERHNGEAFFYFDVKCRLFRGDHIIGEGDGSANSWESKYRFRKSERTCPSCGVPAIIKGKADYGGGWVCFGKKGGCGTKYAENDPAIGEQIVGNVPNPNIFDVVNTVRKIANKRAKIAATLNATSAHEFFTQDVEDMRPEDYNPEEYRRVKEEKVAEAESYNRANNRQPHTTSQQAKQPPPPAISEEEHKLRARMSGKYEALGVFGELKEACQILLGDEQGTAAYYSILQSHGVEKSDQFKTLGKARDCAWDLYQRIQAIKSTQAAKAKHVGEPASEITDDRDSWVPESIGLGGEFPGGNG